MKLAAWLSNLYNRNIVKCRFLYFLSSIFDKKNKNHYFEYIKNIFLTKNKSLVISFQHMVIKDPILAIWLTDEPEKILRIFQDTIFELIKDVFPEYFVNFHNIHIRISNLPKHNFSFDLVERSNNSLIKLRGIIISKTNTYSEFSFFRIICLKCSQLQKPIFSTIEKKKNFFFSCFNCKTDGPFQICNYYTLFSNFQKIKIKEINSINKYFDKFYSKLIILKDDLIDKAKLGEEIEITGIIKYHICSDIKYQNKNQKYIRFLDVNFIEKNLNFYGEIFFKSWEKIFISKIYKKKKIMDFFIDSLSPILTFDRNVRLAFILALFGNSLIKSCSKMKARENVNFLIVGPKNTTKSKFLKSIEIFLPKSVYMNGQETNLKNLTACLKFDTLIEDWVIEGGALVMADKGYFIIDGIDKLGINERKYVNEAMIYKRVYTVRNGIINYLNTNFSVIASAELLYEDIFSHLSNITFFEKSIWHENFISLFDIVCVIRDFVNPVKDENIAKILLEFHTESHMKNNINMIKFSKKKTSNFSNIIDNKNFAQKLILKYITFTRYYIQPKLSEIDQNLISNFYIFIRKQIFLTGGIQMTLKHLESLLKIVQSSARLHLRNNANSFDVQISLIVILNSFTEFQPLITKNVIETKIKTFFNEKQNIFYEILYLLKYSLKKKKYIFKNSFEKLCYNFNINKLLLKKFYYSKLFKNNFFFLEEKKITSKLKK